MAPGATAINTFFISDFSNMLTKATVNNAKVSSIYINAGVGAGGMAIDKFTTLGAGAPFDVFQANKPLTGLLVTYKDSFGGAAIPAGTTAYIVGVFSTIAPNPKKLSDILINKDIGLSKVVYSMFPNRRPGSRSVPGLPHLFASVAFVVAGKLERLAPLITMLCRLCFRQTT